MPSRLIQLNGMNVNAGGLLEFHENIQQRRRPAVQPAKFELVINLRNSKASNSLI